MANIRMVVGEKGGGPSPEVTQRILASDRFFINFASYLIADVGFAHAIESVHGSPSKYSEGDTVRYSCKQDAANWFWRPAPLLNLVSKNLRSDEIFIQRFDGEPIPSYATLNLGSSTFLLQTFAQALITNYFEGQSELVKERCGSNVASWPPVWNFARVVRNAMAHGGLLNIRNSSAPPVSWKGITWTAANNGRDILRHDLWPGDLFDLIIEMDSVL